jgi:transcriptional regulator with XRE-family HTH domain
VSDHLARTLARAVRAERSRLGWSQARLGEALGLSQSSVAAIEAGIRRLNADELPELCATLGVPLRRLLADASSEDLKALGLTAD